MPELGDVEGFRRVVERLEGSRIERVDVLDPGVVRNVSGQRFVRAVRGRRVGRARRVGKWLIVPTDGAALVFHFGMTGSLQWVDRGSSRHPHDRVIFTTEVGELRYRDQRKLQGIFLAVDNGQIQGIVGEIGPDALGIAADDFRARLQAKRSTIKAALIDQTRVAGLGNMLSDEILWRSHIHPGASTADISDSQWKALHRSAQSVLHTAARAGHTPRGPRWLTGARWSQPSLCPACGTELHRSVVNGRTSVWCPTCQTSTSKDSKPASVGIV